MPPRSKRDPNMRSPERSHIEPSELGLDLPAVRSLHVDTGTRRGSAMSASSM